jgi:hypothetical protein
MISGGVGILVLILNLGVSFWLGKQEVDAIMHDGLAPSAKGHHE